MSFEWDPNKEARNREKHGITFEVAAEALGDPDRMEFYQRVEGEDRWKALAWSKKGLLVIAYEEEGSVIRIISARKAEKHEKATYRNRR